MLASFAVLSLHALLTLQAPAAPAPVAGDQTILWFGSSDAAAMDARALLDAVAVYTRDLGIAVRAAPDTVPVPAGAGPDATAAATAALRAQGARLGFWCETRAGAAGATLTVIAADGRLELHVVERTGAHEAELHRAIGLKLRSVLTGTATPEPPPSVPPTPPPPGPSPAPPQADVRATAAPPAARPPRLFGSVGYRVWTPFDAATPRHALALEGALAAGPVFELAAGTAPSPPVEVRVGADSLSIFDWPITVGARVVRRGAGVTFGGGLYAALHLRWASASGNDAGVAQGGSSFTSGGGAGAEALARVPLGGSLAGELRLFAEVPLPTTRYALRGTEAIALGPYAGVGVGLAFPAP